MKKTERRNIYSWVIMILAIAMIIMATSTVTAAANGIPVGSKATVSHCDYLNKRSSPQGEIIGKIACGKELIILSGPDRDNYYKVREVETGEECYVYGEYLTGSSYTSTQQPTNQPKKEKAEVKGTGIYVTVNSDKKLNLRKGAGRDKDRVRYMDNGEILELLNQDVKNNYVKVMATRDGKIGYVDISFVDFSQMQQNQINDNECNCNCECCKQI